MGQPSLRGRLVVATPALADPNFERTVVLILQHDDDGAVGVVVNRPSEIELDEALPDWSPLAAEPATVFAGGPVEPGVLIALARHTAWETDPRDAGAVAEGGGEATGSFEPVAGALGVIDLNAGPEAAPPEVAEVRVFAGYAGWGAGQLDDELDEGAWFVFDAAPEDPFAAEPDRLWRRVIRRQGGVFSLFPDDPTLN